MQNTSGRAFPLVEAKCNKTDDSGYQRRERASVGPGIQTTAKARPRQEKGQPNGENEASDQIKVTDLVPNAEVVELSPALGGFIADHNCCASGSP